MGTRSATTLKKRQKELARMEKQRDKAARKLQRKADKAAGITSPDDDIEAIEPGAGQAEGAEADSSESHS